MPMPMLCLRSWCKHFSNPVQQLHQLDFADGLFSRSG